MAFPVRIAEGLYVLGNRHFMTYGIPYFLGSYPRARVVAFPHAVEILNRKGWGMRDKGAPGVGTESR